MAYTVLIHIHNEDPVLGEVEELPHPTDNFLLVSNLRKRDGKDAHFVDPTAVSVIFPWSRIGFVEVMPSEEEGEVIGFVRE
ncbi:MAG TPA: hypothetical protein VIK33_04050 [Anaerolineae bacterium]